MVALTPHTRLGPYEILGPLGAGGMGEVYRARDTRLGREVAIKVLPRHLASNPEVRSRFEREAKTASSLNHPHICVLHDVGREDNTDYLVMELVEGETLARRLENGSLPTSETLRLGAQIADALDKAHRAGVVHRDLKPGNVMLARTGAKLMDFGLARASALRAEPEVHSHSPTMAQPLTAEGTIVGTFQYMAPEQLEGNEADSRSDIWALGCVLYEMATGKRAFEGKSQASLISSIMKDEPRSMTDLAPLSPPALERAVRQCLAKDPDERWQSAGDLKRELGWIAGAGAQAVGTAGPAAAAALGRRTWAMLATALLVVTALVLAGVLWIPRGERAKAVRFTITAPPAVTFSGSAGDVAISPDGRFVAIVGADSSGRSGLWVRALDNLTPWFLPGSTGASYPFWSPDSRQVAFFADGKLKRTAATGGEVDIVCDAPAGRGGSWSRSGVIAYAPSSSGPLWRVDADRGSPRPLTQLDSTRKEQSHRFPWFLPDGRHFLYITDSVYVGSVESPRRTPLMKAGRAPIYVEPGYLIFAIEDRLVAQRFDPSRLRLQGDPVRLAAQVPEPVNSGDRAASASRTGVLVVPGITEQDLRLAFLDRRGEIVTGMPLPAGFADPRISPDGRRVVLSKGTGENQIDLWAVELGRGAVTRLTFGTKMNRAPTWSPDGRWFVFASNRNGAFDFYLRRSSGAGGDSLLYHSPMGWIYPSSWSPDGRTLVFGGIEKETGYDIWLLHLDDGNAQPYLRTAANEGFAAVSPDGRWIAYQSNESGRYEIYVQSFPTPGTKYQVTTSGAKSGASWASDGRELFFVGADKFLKSVPVTSGDGLEFGTPRTLFSLRNTFGIDVAPDGQRFVAVLPVEGSASTGELQVVLNWTAALPGGR